MSLLKIWIHATWAVKNREKLLDDKIRESLFQHIMEEAGLKNIQIDAIGGCPDHIHCLLLLRNDQSPNMIIQLIKGESALWINRKKLLKDRFDWDKEFIAVSIGESQAGQVREYIHDQNELHQVKTYEEEYHEFLQIYKFEILKS